MQIGQLEVQLQQEQAILVALQQAEKQQQAAGRPLVGVGAGVGRTSSDGSAAGFSAPRAPPSNTSNVSSSMGSAKVPASYNTAAGGASAAAPPSTHGPQALAAAKPVPAAFSQSAFEIADSPLPPKPGQAAPQAPSSATSQGSQGSRLRPAFGAGIASRAKADARPANSAGPADSVGSVGSASFQTAASDGDDAISPGEVRSAFKSNGAAYHAAANKFSGRPSDVIDLTDD